MATEKNKSKSRKQKFLFTRREVATIYDVNEKTIDKWKNNGCPFEADAKKYDIRKVVQWRNIKTSEFVENAEENEENKIKERPLNEQIAIYKRDVLKNDAELKNLKLRIQKGDLLDKKQVSEDIINGLLMFKTSVKNMSNKVANLIAPYVPNDVQRIIADEVDKLSTNCLNKLSKGENYE